jgi:Ca2+-binding EF-hand superfamily protein
MSASELVQFNSEEKKVTKNISIIFLKMGQGQSNAASSSDLAEATTFSEAEVEAIMEAFNELSPRGKPIKMSEFGELMKRVGAKFPDGVTARYQGVSPDQVAMVFVHLDDDNNKKVDLEELIVGLSLFRDGSVAEKAAHLFKLFDRNKDGQLSLAELRFAVKRSLGCILRVSRETTGEMKREMLENGVPKFVVSMAGIAVNPELLRDAIVDRIVAEAFIADTDADRKLSRDEWIAAAESNRIIGALIDPLSGEFKSLLSDIESSASECATQ